MIYYKIVDITDKQGQPRTDAAYSNRIGSTVWVEYEPEVGSRYVMAYASDNRGHPRQGMIITSAIQNWHETHAGLVIETLNSVFYLQEVASCLS